MPLGLTFEHNPWITPLIILENKLPLRPVTKWVSSWSGGFELEQLQALIGGIGGRGSGRKKKGKETKTRGGAGLRGTKTG